MSMDEDYAAVDVSSRDNQDKKKHNAYASQIWFTATV